MKQVRSGMQVSAILAAALFLSACGGSGAGGSADPSAAPATAESSAEQSAATKELQLVSAGNADGYYTTEEWGNAAIVTYIDYASRQQMPLCSRPECAHSDSSCTAYALIENMAVPVLALLEDQLAIIQTAPTEDAPARVMLCRPDGSNPQTLCQLDATVTLRPEIYTDAQNLYALAGTVQNSTPVMQLIRISLQDGRVDLLYTFPENSDAQLLTGFGTRLGLSLAYEELSTGETRYAVELYDTATGEMEQPLVEQPFDSQQGATLFGDVLVQTTGQQATFTDLSDGTILTWQADTLAAQAGMPNAQIIVFGLWDGWYRVQLLDAETNRIADYHVNPSTGETIPMTLYYKDQQNVILVLAQSGDNLLVRAAWNMQQSGGDITSLRPVYALISRDDYLHSRPNYQYITGM